MKILSPKEWIENNHPDPDNIHECNINYTTGDVSYPIKEETCYSLMQAYSDYVKEQTFYINRFFVCENCLKHIHKDERIEICKSCDDKKQQSNKELIKEIEERLDIMSNILKNFNVYMRIKNETQFLEFILNKLK
jgi:hypothetical protein